MTIDIPQGWLPQGVQAVALEVGGDYAADTDELAAVANAVAQRRAEFVAGRACAHRALEALGCAYQPLPAGENRVPLWPAGFVGSISHSRTLAVAAVCRRGVLDAIGIDVHPAAPLEPELWPMIAAPGEQPLRGERGLAESLRFSCKEAAFKCWFTAGGDRLLEFRDVRLQVSDGDFVAWMPGPGPATLKGRWTLAHGHFWAVAMP